MRTLARTLLVALTLAACSAADDAPSLPGGGSGGVEGTGGAGGTGGAPPQPEGLPTVIPDALVIQPGGGRAFLLDAIAGAQATVRAVSYLLTDDAVEDALIAAHGRGVEVRVILPDDSTNTPARNKLVAAGIAVRDGNPGFALTHEKAVVVDDERAFVLTQNLTVSGFDHNREFDLSLSGTPARAVAAIFDADWNWESFHEETDLVLSPTNSRARLEALLKEAEREIAIEMEVFNDGRIADLLVALDAAGIDVRVVLDDPASIDDNADMAERLTAAGVEVRWLAQPNVHAKAIVVDDRLAYTGSVNFTYHSLDRNREVGVITDDPATVSRIAETIDADFAAGNTF